MTVARTAIVQEARSWIGTPYQHQQRAKRVGVDCAGLVIGVARNLGLVSSQFDINGYARRPDGRSLIEHCDRAMARLAGAEAMQPGDVIVLRFDVDPQHVGIVADYYLGGCLSIIHALGTRDGKGRVAEHRLDATTLRRFVAAYRLPGVA
jgi:cell wall-associated NlpC family hydrolase